LWVVVCVFVFCESFACGFVLGGSFVNVSSCCTRVDIFLY
jgi:hypothetical protein